jgi:hypothetical protein
MAKELPYFKFEPNQWENGIIQMSSQHEKGVFVDLCSMYWSRLGDVPYKLAVQKICGGNATALDSLYDNKIIDIIDGNIFIKFLSEQLNEFEDTSKQNSKNAKEGWIKRRKQREESERNATASNPQCESDAIREDKIREDEIKEDDYTEENNTATPFSFYNSLISLGAEKKLASDWIKVRKTKRLTNTETAFNSLKIEFEKSGKPINKILDKCITESWGGFKSSWNWNNEVTQKEKPKYIPLKF